MQFNYMMVKPTKPVSVKKAFVKEFKSLNTKIKNVFYVSALRQITGEYYCRLDIFDDKIERKLLEHNQILPNKVAAIEYLKAPLKIFNVKHRDIFIYNRDCDISDLTATLEKWIKGQL